MTAIAADADPERVFSDGVFRSDADPVLAVRINPKFAYLGSDKFILKDIAAVDRHHWVRTRDDDIEAMIVIQFERLLDGVDGGYRFGIPDDDNIAGGNFRFSPSPIRLGDHDYVHNSWAFDNYASAKDNPGAESERTIQFLEKNGLNIDHELIMSRYVRAVGDDRRKEIIFFYMETLERNGHSLQEFPDGGPPSEVFDKLASEVKARATLAFDVLATDQPVKSPK